MEDKAPRNANGGQDYATDMYIHHVPQKLHAAYAWSFFVSAGHFLYNRLCRIFQRNTSFIVYISQLQSS